MVCVSIAGVCSVDGDMGVGGWCVGTPPTPLAVDKGYGLVLGRNHTSACWYAHNLKPMKRRRPTSGAVPPGPQTR